MDENVKSNFVNSLLFGLCVLFFGSTRAALAQDVVLESSTSRELGDVVYSLLPPELFKLNHSGEWKILDGSELAASTQLQVFLEKQGGLSTFNRIEFSKGSEVILPDARGVFIRGMSSGRSLLTGDPQGDIRNVGSYQSDQIGKHSHQIEIPGDVHRVGSSNSSKSIAAPFLEGYKDKRLKEFRSASAGSNKQAKEDIEFRPKNITLYIYLKTDD